MIICLLKFYMLDEHIKHSDHFFGLGKRRAPKSRTGLMIDGKPLKRLTGRHPKEGSLKRQVCHFVNFHITSL